MQDLPVILKLHYLQSLDKALDCFIDLKFCHSGFYFLNRRKQCKVAVYSVGLMYIITFVIVQKLSWIPNMRGSCR